MLVMVCIVNGGLHATFCDRNSDIKLHKINRHIIVLTSTKKITATSAQKIAIQCKFDE